MKITLKSALAFVCATAGAGMLVPAGANAALVTAFDNINISGTSWTDAGVGVSGNSPSGAQKFNAVNGFLDSVTLMLAPENSLGNLIITLQSHNAGTDLPNGALYTIYSGPAPSVSGFTAITFSGLNYALTGGASYWIAMDLPNYPAGVRWAYDQNNVQPAGAVAQPFRNAYSQGSNHAPPWTLAFNDGPLGLTVIEAVPEPSTIAMGVITVLGAAGVWMRRRHQA